MNKKVCDGKSSVMIGLLILDSSLLLILEAILFFHQTISGGLIMLMLFGPIIIIFILFIKNYRIEIVDDDIYYTNFIGHKKNYKITDISSCDLKASYYVKNAMNGRLVLKLNDGNKITIDRDKRNSDEVIIYIIEKTMSINSGEDLENDVRKMKELQSIKNTGAEREYQDAHPVKHAFITWGLVALFIILTLFYFYVSYNIHIRFGSDWIDKHALLAMCAFFSGMLGMGCFTVGIALFLDMKFGFVTNNIKITKYWCIGVLLNIVGFLLFAI